jgi:myo-inositol-1(or 4)-monophosphatase
VSDLHALARRLKSVAAEAARAVAPDLRDAFRTGMDVAFKRDHHDPVTEHDRRAEEKIRALLLRREPDSSVIGEEAGASDGAGRVRWYVDPIDGTANFARGLAFFCVSVGAAVDGQPVAGAIVDPMAGHVFTADLDGAWLGEQRLVSTGVRDERRALLISSFPSSRELDRGDPESLTRFGTLVSRYGTVRRPGSAALSLAHVAAGWSDAALGTSVNAWDTCAAQVLVRRAGGGYVPFGGSGWDQPGYLAHTADLVPATLHDFVAWYTRRARGGPA